MTTSKITSSEQNSIVKGYNENMTLILAIEGRDCLITLTDSREQFNSVMKDNALKMLKLSDTVTIMTSGASETINALLDKAKPRIQGKRTISSVVDELRKSFISSYADWYKGFNHTSLNDNKQLIWPVGVFLVVGYDVDSSPKIYVLQSVMNFSPQLMQDYGAGGMPQYSQYLLSRLYKKDTPLKQLIELGVFVMNETMTQEASVGGPIKAVWMKKDGTSGEYSETELAEITEKNNIRFDELRESFYKKT